MLMAKKSSSDIQVQARDHHCHACELNGSTTIIELPVSSRQSIRPLLDTFYALASKMADTLSSRIDDAQGEAIEEDVQWWANRFSEEVTASAAEPIYDDLLERVPYLDAVLKECLRLHPAIIELTHVVSLVSISRPAES
ncbi:hypothetical protein JB92DRAFT_1032058 [Gautieria morchelliformis]|nr:hypothetical protein JB92DRAFT_1032058 [Gautieria morchelliformis]